MIEQDQFSLVGIYAQELADSAKIAFWTTDEMKQFHQKTMIGEFEKLANVLGYDIVKMETK